MLEATVAVRVQTPLVGRDQAVARLRCALTLASERTGTCMIVEGPPGIGKTRLLAEAAAEAHALGMVVATARATELDRIAPLTTLLMALRSCRPAVLDAGGIASLSSLGTQQGSGFWVVSQLGIQIEQFAATRALVVVLDDIQWADELTALALRILVPTLGSSRVMWLLACRPPAGRSPVREVLDWLIVEGAQRLILEPLPDETVTELCTEILGTTPSTEIMTLAQRAGGNPFLLEELITAFQRTGLTHHEQPPPVADRNADLPCTLVDAVDLRLRHLSRAARQVLDAGAVLSRVFTVPEIAGVLFAQPADVHDAVTELVDKGILIGDTEVEFRHDLIRDAVYSRLTESERRTLHGEIGRMLLHNGRPVTEVATHVVRGARKGDASAISVLRQAAQDLTSTAPSTAADLMLHMLALLDDRDPERPLLTATTVRLLASASRLTEARELGEAALRFRLSDAAQAAMLLGLAEALKHAGQDTAAVEYAGRALSRPAVPNALKAQLLAIQAHGMLADGDVEGADLAAIEAVEVGTGCEEQSAIVFGLAARSAIAHWQGRLGDAIAQAGEAVKLADLAGGEARHRHPRLWLARALVAADRFGEAEAVLELGEREAHESGAVWSLPLWHLVRAELKFAAGNLDDAQAEAESGVAVSERLTARALTPALLSLLSRVAVQRGEVSLAEQYLRRAGLSVDAHRLFWSHALFYDAVGDTDRAVRVLSPLYASMHRHALLLTVSPGAGPQLVRLARKVGDDAKAQAAAAAAVRMFELNPGVASLAGAAAHAAGVFRDDPEALREAVEQYRTSPRRLAMASAIEDSGVAEHSRGDDGQAVALLEEAHGHYVASGARRDAARVEQRLRALGVRRRRQRPGTNRARGGANRLTESELRVVTLVVEGLTNRVVAERLFLSPHTVDAHLRHAFSKLGVSSRVELTRAILLQGANDELT
jgi:ATP/maltotriose-dependent transcriptional regulator MalT